MNDCSTGLASLEEGVGLAESVEKKLVCDVPELDMESIREDLCQLEERLNRVRSWGGAYAEIDFSDHVKMLLGNEKSKIVA